MFGDALGGRAGEALRLIRGAGPGGLGRAELGAALFGSHYTHARLGRVLGPLVTGGHVHRDQRPTSGRTAECWVAAEYAREERNPRAAPAAAAGEEGGKGGEAGAAPDSTRTFSPSTPSPFAEAADSREPPAWATEEVPLPPHDGVGGNRGNSGGLADIEPEEVLGP